MPGQRYNPKTPKPQNPKTKKPKTPNKNKNKKVKMFNVFLK